jgi:putative ABC transport system permease protein
MKGLIQDLRYALRQLRKSPGFTAVAIITLALGIGANTAIFSSVNAMLLRPFPFHHLDRIVSVWEDVPKQNDYHLSAAPANFRDWREQNKVFQRLAALQAWDVNLTGGNVAQHVEGFRVTGDFFSLLGMPMHLGRSIGSADCQQGAPPVIVIEYGFWQQHLGSDPGIVGKQLLLNGEKFTVSGITSPDFDFPPGAQIWTPLNLTDKQATDRQSHSLNVIARLADGVSISDAQANLQAIAARLAQQYPDTNTGHEVSVKNTVEDLMYGTRQFVLLLMGAAVFVLLLCCANVANLQLVRAFARQKEIALRTALGATRWHIGRQLLVESVLLALLGSAGALLLARWGIALMRRNLPPFIVEHVAGLKHLEVDSRVFPFTLAVAVATGIITGLAPAWHLSRPNVNDTLKEGGRSSNLSVARHRLRTLLVVSEVALSLVLLVGAGTMIKGFQAMVASDMGFDRSHVLTFRVALPEAKYRDQDRLREYYDRVLRDTSVLPGVESVACATSLPSGWNWNWVSYIVEGKPPVAPGETPSAISQVVTPRFFSALRVPLRRGRLLSEQDGRDAPAVAVVSEDMARRNWPGEDPLGKRIQMGAGTAAPMRTIVGIVGNVSPNPFDHDPAPTVYVPLAQQPELTSAFVVRTTGDPLALAASISAQMRNVDADQPAYDVRSLEQILSDNLSGIEQTAQMMLVFGFSALLLAAAGIFAVMAYSVTQRTHEIGVRIALGARRADVLRLVVGFAMKMAAVGLVIGLVLATLLTRALSSALFGVVQTDVATFTVLTFLLAAVAVLAAYIPARWATKVDPMVALRYE